MSFYILNEDKTVQEASFEEAAEFFEDFEKRRIKVSKFSNQNGDEILVSTIFLIIDHNCSVTGPPLLFETMVFEGKHDKYQQRCSTWAEAIAMHNEACQLVKQSL